MPGMNLTDAKKNRDYFDTLTTSLVFNVLKPMSEEGRLTKDDFEYLQKMAGQPSMDISLRRVLLENVRNSVEQAISTRPGTHQQWGRRGGRTVGAGTGASQWSTDQYSNEQLLAIPLAELDLLSVEDLDALEAEMRSRGLE